MKQPRRVETARRIGTSPALPGASRPTPRGDPLTIPHELDEGPAPPQVKLGKEMTLRGRDGDAIVAGEATPEVTNKCGTTGR